MKDSLLKRLEQMAERREELARELARPETAADAERLRSLAQEYAQLGPAVSAYQAHRALSRELAELEALRGDTELGAMAEAELAAARARRAALEEELRGLLAPRDPLDGANAFVEIRAGTGGDEAALFAGDLFRMYARYAERRGWDVEVLSRHPGEHGGYKEIVARLAGQGVYGRLKFESGVHRVQRVPQTEASGRIHTSAATVAVLPEVEAAQEVQINPAELKVDTFRASGAGGQHVNKTESAIRITHLPSGIVVECQEERSQHKNRARALALLQARLVEIERSRRERQTAAARKRLVGSGDRSERIRTYNFPQGRVTDHRIELTLYQLARVLEGELDAVIEPLLAEYRAERLDQAGEAAP
jgi:peptide chain release factor 1